MPPLDFDWNIDLAVMELIEQLRLPPRRSMRLYSGLHGEFPAIVGAARAGTIWPLHLVERRYSWWPGLQGHVDLETGKLVDPLPGRPPVESLAYDLAELARRKKESRDAARAEGGGEEGGVREDSG